LVKDIITSGFKSTFEAALDVVKTLNTSTSKWLPRLRDVMERLYGKS